MRKLLILPVMFVFAAFVSVSGIEGKWVAEMDSPNGPVQLTYNFEVDGDTLTGTVEGGMGDITIENGKVDGNTFSFDTSFNDFTVNHKCTLNEDDTITMKFNFGQQEQEMTLTRAEDDDTEK